MVVDGKRLNVCQICFSWMYSDFWTQVMATAKRAKAGQRQNVVILHLSSCRLPSFTMCAILSWKTQLNNFLKDVIYCTEQGLFG